MPTGNPVLNDKAFNDVRASGGEAMTTQGTANKTLVLLALVVISASWVWNNPATLMPLYLPALIGGFIVAMITVFKKEWSPVTAPLYALLEGVLLGGISVLFERSYAGIVMQAVGLTFGTHFALLMAYKSGFVTVTQNFRLGVVAATGGIAIFYIVTMVLGFCHINVPIFYGNGFWGIGFSIFVVVIAALNLVLDFDFIDQAVQAGAPKYMEWYGAFGLMVTLIWLYMEILRLLAKSRRR